MPKVTLYTRNGGGLVAQVELQMPFQLMPEIIMWGQRFFVRDIFRDTVGGFGYTEGLMYPIMDVKS